MKNTVKHDGGTQKFFTSVAGKDCTLKYEKVSENIWDFKILFVPANMRGQGIAAKVVDYAINFARKNDIKVKVSCSYIKEYLKDKKDRQDVLLKPEQLTSA